ncbi:hypothetical protein G6011_03406 [Alternaria panax]|uniref:Uncharacterized protein n=1 Tax=Alternaria panax TaxID=48097 RepID=A0AAD4NR08_9PLEO|nr:hypothetical protein G6011_03406 [Alternaria panax]
MDTTFPEMIHFVIVPIETVVACIYVLDNILSALAEDEPHTKQNTQYIRGLKANGRSLIDGIVSWPLVVQENSLKHNTLLPGFTTNGIKVNNDGTIKQIGIILLEQTRARSWYMDWGQQADLIVDEDDNKLRYHSFLTQLMWMREDAPVRMFAKGFSGQFREDEASNVTMNTLPTTRTTSPALTERQDVTADESTEQQAILPPTLKYIAIIETHTDKAFFNLDISDINEKKRKVINSAKEMCTEMVFKGYGGKVKLQDIMDMAVKMAENSGAGRDKTWL